MSSSELAVGENCAFEYVQAVEENPIIIQKSSSSGVTDYPVIDFDKQALDKLTYKVETSLKNSELKPGGGAFYRFAKRTIDIVGSLMGLVVLAIPMGIVSLLIYLEDKGNPIFVQERLTKDGKVFRMYKFRSMCTDAEKKFHEVQIANQTDGLAFKMDNDPRITKIGRAIRKLSIDELPQLVNVLKGDMSLIGPRPPLPREVNLYSNYQMQRLLVKSGLSCYCQCSGRSDMPFDEWVESDLRYIKERSLGIDIKLMFKTVKAVFYKNGAR